MKNGCQLITYPDSLGENLSELRGILKSDLAGLFTGVHVLPFFPSSGDRGFAPLTYTEVDEAFGTWTDIEAIADEYDLIVDYMINHISRRSTYFRDFVARKDDSRYRDLFIRYRDFWPDGAPSKEDLERIYTRKPRPPYVEVTFEDGTVEKIWCTFGEEQIDLNVDTDTGRRFMADALRGLCDHGAKVIRLDAVAYATKRPGTDCFFLEPDIYRLLDSARETAEPLGAELLPEVHEHYTYQEKLERAGYPVYDFALPFLMLHALYESDGTYLVDWLRTCPRHQITTLDTHDGIGVVDVADLMPQEAIERTQEHIYEYGANVKRRYSSADYHNLDVYQVNCTYYSALGDDDEAYLLARAVQCFAPGIPQIYYVGLLAGRNDIELVEQTKNGRDINRHGYTPQEVRNEVGRPVVQRLFRLLEFRNRSPAFGAEIDINRTSKTRFSITRRNDIHRAKLTVDLQSRSFSIETADDGETLNRVEL